MCYFYTRSYDIENTHKHAGTYTAAFIIKLEKPSHSQKRDPLVKYFLEESNSSWKCCLSKTLNSMCVHVCVCMCLHIYVCDCKYEWVCMCSPRKKKKEICEKKKMLLLKSWVYINSFLFTLWRWLVFIFKIHDFSGICVGGRLLQLQQRVCLSLAQLLSHCLHL